MSAPHLQVFNSKCLMELNWWANMINSVDFVLNNIIFWTRISGRQVNISPERLVSSQGYITALRAAIAATLGTGKNPLVLIRFFVKSVLADFFGPPCTPPTGKLNERHAPQDAPDPTDNNDESGQLQQPYDDVDGKRSSFRFDSRRRAAVEHAEC